ncbi:hypothetical protein ACW7N6_38555 [Streptomyces sp. UC1A3]
MNRGDEVVQASQSWVHTAVADVVPEIDEPRACDPTWQAVYQDRSGNPVRAASKIAYVRATTPTEREEFGLDADRDVLVTRSVYVTGNTVIGVGEAAYAPGHPLILS